ncbi:MAG: hypothetical protein GY822_23165 [Deltaproteobacteria bacterium]|nr:hypothetical protein [Deltaproteobacteria bacterium]
MQSKLFIWFYNQYPEFRILSKNVKTPRCLLIHNYLNPKNKIDGAKLNAAGLCKGFPDLSLYVPRGDYFGLIIELKMPGEKPRPEQFDVINALRVQGYKVVWCDSLEQSKNEIINYLSI